MIRLLAFGGKATPPLLNLGRVRDLAKVLVNGRTVGIVWLAPYRIGIAAAGCPGRDRIEVRVANLSINRLSDDAQPDSRKPASTVMPRYRPDAPLRGSGMIGLVTVQAV